jgi:hypothetical protein
MLPPADQLTVRATVIAGEKGKDDFLVIWNGISIGRVLKVAGVAGRETWNWGVAFPRMPQLRSHRTGDLEECKRRFKVVWSAIHRELTEADVEAVRTDQAAVKDRPWSRHRGDSQ